MTDEEMDCRINPLQNILWGKLTFLELTYLQGFNDVYHALTLANVVLHFRYCINTAAEAVKQCPAACGYHRNMHLEIISMAPLSSISPFTWKWNCHPQIIIISVHVQRAN